MSNIHRLLACESLLLAPLACLTPLLQRLQTEAAQPNHPTHISLAANTARAAHHTHSLTTRQASPWGSQPHHRYTSVVMLHQELYLGPQQVRRPPGGDALGTALGRDASAW